MAIRSSEHVGWGLPQFFMARVLVGQAPPYISLPIRTLTTASIEARCATSYLLDRVVDLLFRREAAETESHHAGGQAVPHAHGPKNIVGPGSPRFARRAGRHGDVRHAGEHRRRFDTLERDARRVGQSLRRVPRPGAGNRRQQASFKPVPQFRRQRRLTAQLLLAQPARHPQPDDPGDVLRPAADENAPALRRRSGRPVSPAGSCLAHTVPPLLWVTGAPLTVRRTPRPRSRRSGRGR